MIQAFIHGFALRKTKEGAFSVSMTDGKHKLDRTYKVAGTTANQAELRAAQFALMAVPIGSEVELNTSSHYLNTILERGEEGEWLKSPKANAEIIDEIRQIIKDLKVKVVKSDNEGIQKVKESARSARS